MISENKQGYLTCSEDSGGIWCEHIERYVRDMEDADLLWNGELEGERVIAIPMTPTHNQWLEVNLHYRKVRGSHYAKVFADFSQYHGVRGGFDVDLGMLSPGEGRMTLRDMTIAWAQGAIEVDKLSCAASSHGYSQASRLDKDLMQPDRCFPQIWSMFTAGTCLACTYSNSTSDDIPQNEGYTSKFPKKF